MDKISDEARMWAYAIGYVGVAIVVTAICYKWFAHMVGIEVAKSLVKAGVIAIA